MAAAAAAAAVPAITFDARQTDRSAPLIGWRVRTHALKFQNFDFGAEEVEEESRESEREREREREREKERAAINRLLQNFRSERFLLWSLFFSSNLPTPLFSFRINLLEVKLSPDEARSFWGRPSPKSSAQTQARSKIVSNQSITNVEEIC